MEQVQRPRPTCESSCCTADPGPGAWIVDKQAPGHKVPPSPQTPTLTCLTTLSHNLPGPRLVNAAHR